MDWVTTHQPEARWLLSVSADCPFLPADLVACLHAQQARTHARIVVASSGGEMHPVIALWDIGLRDDLSRALHDDDLRRVRAFITRFPYAVAEWPTGPVDPFFNANTPDDLREAERLAQGPSNG
jgi:molybdopterin-guanine dinucleotide biosynthesis protein A